MRGYSELASGYGTRYSRRLWACVIALLVAIQFGLLLHHAQHHLNPDILGGNDCALCQITSGITVTPTAPAIVVPIFVLLGTIVLLAIVAPRTARIALPFHSRAPPAFLAV